MERTRRLAGWLVLLVLICTPAQSQGQVCGEGILPIGGCETQPVQVPVRKVAGATVTPIPYVADLIAGWNWTDYATNTSSFSSWPSVTGNADYNASTSTEVDKPAYNGTGLVFNNCMLTTKGTVPITASNSWSIFVRGTRLGYTSYDQVVSDGVGGNHAAFSLFGNNSTPYYGSGGGSVVFDAGAVDGSQHVYAVTTGGGTSKVYRDSAQQGASKTSYPQPAYRVFIGRRGASFPCNWHIKNIYIYTGDKTSAVSEITNYLNALP